MNSEKDIVRKSLWWFIGLLIISIVIGVYFENIAYPVGLIVGYVISYIVFMLTVLFTDIVVKGNKSMALVGVVMFSYLMRMFLYIAGFALAVIYPQYISIFFVAVGYGIVKVTIMTFHIGNKKEVINE